MPPPSTPAASPGLVFVYGTLKKGFSNHRQMEGAVFRGNARTKSLHALYVARLPHLMRDEPVSAIHGEAYEVAPAVLARLDAFEGHPDWYRRETVTVILADGSETPAWTYFARTRRGRLTRSGSYRERKHRQR